MTVTALRDQLHAEPFRSFLIKTTDGDTFPVSHPDYALISDGDTEVTIHESDGHYRVVAVPHIVSLEPVREQIRKPGKR